MEKTIDENKQGTKLVLEEKKENTKKLFIESYGCAHVQLEIRLNKLSERD